MRNLILTVLFILTAACGGSIATQPDDTGDDSADSGAPEVDTDAGTDSGQCRMPQCDDICNSILDGPRGRIAMCNAETGTECVQFLPERSCGVGWCCLAEDAGK